MANKTFEEIKETRLDKQPKDFDDYNKYTGTQDPAAEKKLHINNKNKFKSPLQRFTGAVIPMGSDSIGEVIRKVILLISVAAVIVCFILILNDMRLEGRQAVQDKVISDLKETVEISGVIPLESQKIEEIQKQAPGILDKYVALYDQNPDIVGWITVGGTPIDYPVMQSNDNDFYLYRDFNKKDSKMGSIFADYHVKLTPDSRPNNTVLYGHNISNGTYFAKLTNYYPKKYGSLDFYLTYPTLTFDTIYEEGTYKIFAAIYINTEERHGDVYEYYKKCTFPDKASFFDFAQNIMDRSMFYTDVDLEYGDEILTLSTCYYPFGSNVDTRFVVFARRVREGESAEVDVSKAYINQSPLFFDYYYKNVGGSWAGRTWDTGLVKGLDEFLSENVPVSETEN